MNGSRSISGRFIPVGGKGRRGEGHQHLQCATNGFAEGALTSKIVLCQENHTEDQFCHRERDEEPGNGAIPRCQRINTIGNMFLSVPELPELGEHLPNDQEYLCDERRQKEKDELKDRRVFTSEKQYWYSATPSL